MALNMDEKLIEYLTPNEANEKISQYLQDMRDEPASCILYTISLTKISQAFHLSNIGVTGSDRQNSSTTLSKFGKTCSSLMINKQIFTNNDA